MAREPPARSVPVPADRAVHRSRPTLSDFSAALGTLTILPFERADPQSGRFARAALFFPVCGLLTGAGLACIDRLLGPSLPAGLEAVVLVVAWEALGGFGTLHALVTRRNATRSDRWLGAAITVFLLGVKADGLYGAVATRTAALLFAPMLGRWAMVVLATGARSADAPTRKFNPGITFREFALTSVFTLVALFILGEATGVLVAVCAAALALGVRLLLHRWPGGVSWASLQSAGLLVETAVVLLFAALAS